MHQLDSLTANVLERVARGPEPADAVALTFLLRRYASTGDTTVREALGGALAIVLSDRIEDAESLTTADQAAWLALFAEARAFSEDDRLGRAAGRLAARLLDAIRSMSRPDRAVTIDACLRAARACSDVIIAVVIDHLEDLVSRSYRPGEGVGGGLDDQMSVAAALLTGFSVTGRLPYAMLAEELVQTARRRGWDDRTGAFGEWSDAAATKQVVVNCRAARVLCRLAALHADPEYRAAAVVAPQADYRGDAGRILAYFKTDAAEGGAAAALYGLALADYLDLQ